VEFGLFASGELLVAGFFFYYPLGCGHTRDDVFRRATYLT
jgi:hypothetical protein